jgi:acetyltransferase-like isoleucine patch superfamily enzyme
MMQRFELGDLIQFRTGPHRGEVAIISNPVDAGSGGHAITLRDGCLYGVDVTMGEIVPASSASEGFAQLANNLIKLGSHVIEDRLIV